MTKTKFSVEDNKDFGEYILSPSALKDAVEWIRNNLCPDDIFDYEQLEDWAKDHNFEEKG